MGKEEIFGDSAVITYACVLCGGKEKAREREGLYTLILLIPNSLHARAVRALSQSWTSAAFKRIMIYDET